MSHRVIKSLQSHPNNPTTEVSSYCGSFLPRDTQVANTSSTGRSYCCDHTTSSRKKKRWARYYIVII